MYYYYFVDGTYSSRGRSVDGQGDRSDFVDRRAGGRNQAAGPDRGSGPTRRAAAQGAGAVPERQGNDARCRGPAPEPDDPLSSAAHRGPLAGRPLAGGVG